MRSLLLAATAAALLPATAAAQWSSGQFSVTPRGGFMMYDDASGIDDAPYFGVEASYSFSPFFSVGTGLNVSRPQTLGDQFISQLTFGDTTYYFAVEQPLMLIDAGLTATGRYPGDLVTPYVMGGVGYYTLDLDPQVETRPERSSDVSGMLGAGLHFRVGRNVGIQLEVRDLIFTGFDRDDLNPVESEFNNTRFPEDFAPPPAAKSTVHNLMFGIGFSFTPRSGAVTDGQQGGNQ